MFSEKDLEQIKAKGISQTKLAEQIKNFEEGFPFLELKKVATIGDGILKFDEKEIDDYVKMYESEMSKHQIYKFVPASGAASRMFKSLFSFMEKYDGSDEAIKDFEGDTSFGSVFTFFKNIKQFAFYGSLKSVIAESGTNIDELIYQEEYGQVLRYLLTTTGLNYGGLPKGLLEFHNYKTVTRTPLEEHLVEGANYCKDKDGKVDIHFTVSPEHKALFREKVLTAGQPLSDEYKSEFKAYFSEQQAYTDTIAVDLENHPFRNVDGSILFRPAGHGALLENLNTIDADIVFIKNIDNVVAEQYVDEVAYYKKVLGGKLLWLQKKIFSYLVLLDKKNTSTEKLNEMKSFLRDELNNRESILTSVTMKKIFNRPLRVCGVVKNTGAPGGGPFWVQNGNTLPTLQIVEMSQIDSNNQDHQAIVESATHFNPVDLVCGLKDYKGSKFDFRNFIDHNSGFIVEKNKFGKPIKGYELPGLWNGAMANWITIFVEVPLITFNPVKTINDLLKPAHQNH